MGYISVTLNPGIDIEKTPVLNETGWSASNNVRFFEGLPQKIGGWTTLNASMPYPSYVRGLHCWADNIGVVYLAAGTAINLSIFLGGSIYDATPLRKTTNSAVAFTTTISTSTVQIHDVAHGAAVGDRINIVVPVSVGGLIILGYYNIASVVDADNYTVTAASNATASVGAGGAVPQYVSSAGSPNLTVNFSNHGLTTTSLYTGQVSTAVSSFTIFGIYAVSSVTNVNTFVIQPGGNAVGNATVSENSGNARIQYLIPSGISSAVYAVSGGGYGVGSYGGGTYGGGATGGTYLVQLRYWSLLNFGQVLIANYNGGPLYTWTPPETGTTLAVTLDTTNYPGATDPPKQANWIFGSATQQMVIALGCNTAGISTYDPLSVRWCDAGDFTAWTATSTNLAGSFRIPSGSKLITGIATANFNIIWTDVDMWLMSFLGAPLVWGFQKIADAVDCISPMGCGVYRNMVFWASSNGFYMYAGGSVQQIPCPVWDKFWFNLNRLQSYKINIQVNSWFGEISWGFPSATGNGEIDSRVTYKVEDNVWTYDSIARTDWIDENPLGAPIGVDVSPIVLQQHETSNDANNVALPSSVTSGWFTMTEGDPQAFIERLAADVIATGGNQQVQITLYVKDWPTSPIRTLGPFTYTADGVTGPSYSIVRSRGRLAQIKIASTSTGVFWRLGRIRLLLGQAGRGN